MGSGNGGCISTAQNIADRSTLTPSDSTYWTPMLAMRQRVLSQIVEGEEHVVAYYSKKFSPLQQNYCVSRRELLAVVMATNYFRPYLYGQEFRLPTDHASLLWLYKRTEPSYKVTR